MESKNYLVKHIAKFVNKIRFYLIFNKNQLWKCQKKMKKWNRKRKRKRIRKESKVKRYFEAQKCCLILQTKQIEIIYKRRCRTKRCRWTKMNEC